MDSNSTINNNSNSFSIPFQVPHRPRPPHRRASSSTSASSHLNSSSSSSSSSNNGYRNTVVRGFGNASSSSSSGSSSVAVAVVSGPLVPTHSNSLPSGIVPVGGGYSFSSATSKTAVTSPPSSGLLLRPFVSGIGFGGPNSSGGGGGSLLQTGIPVGPFLHRRLSASDFASSEVSNRSNSTTMTTMTHRPLFVKSLSDSATSTVSAPPPPHSIIVGQKSMKLSIDSQSGNDVVDAKTPTMTSSLPTTTTTATNPFRPRPLLSQSLSTCHKPLLDPSLVSQESGVVRPRSEEFVTASAPAGASTSAGALAVVEGGEERRRHSSPSFVGGPSSSHTYTYNKETEGEVDARNHSTPTGLLKTQIPIRNGNSPSPSSLTSSSSSSSSIPQNRMMMEGGSVLDPAWLESKSREDLEVLLKEADRIIKERQRDLELVATIGKNLLEENISLRNRHESILARTNFEPPCSPPGSFSILPDVSLQPSTESTCDEPDPVQNDLAVTFPSELSDRDSIMRMSAKVFNVGKAEQLPEAVGRRSAPPAGVGVVTHFGSDSTKENDQERVGSHKLRQRRSSHHLNTTSPLIRPSSIVPSYKIPSRSHDCSSSPLLKIVTPSQSFTTGQQQQQQQRTSSMTSSLLFGHDTIQSPSSTVTDSSFTTTTPTTSQGEMQGLDSPCSINRRVDSKRRTSSNRRRRRSSSLPSRREQVDSLNVLNDSLNFQLVSLEQESETVEREGRRQLRQLEKEINSLKVELKRVEERNERLEQRDFQKQQQQQQHQHQHQQRHQQEKQQRRWSSSSVSFMGNSAVAAANRSLIPFYHDIERDDDATSNDQKKAEEDGPQTIERSTPEAIEEAEDDEEEEGFTSSKEQLVLQLKAKIDELQRMNTSIADDKTDMIERLAQAQKEVNDFKTRCDELEDLVEAQPHIEYKARRGVIEWRSDNAADTAPRASTSQTEKQRRHRSISISPSHDSTTSSVRSECASPSPQSRSRNRFRLSVRSLGSELGDSRWEDRCPEDVQSDKKPYKVSENGRTREEKERGCSSSTTGSESTSTPTRANFSRQPFSSAASDTGEILDTSSDLFAPGSLRYGMPDGESYEQISRVASQLPAIWEDEHDFGRPPPRPPRSVLRALEYSEHAESAGGAGFDVWETSVYPEQQETDFDRIEDSATIARREKQERNLKRRARAAEKLIHPHMGRTQRAEHHANRRNVTLTRRQIALQRLGWNSGLGGGSNECDQDEDGDGTGDDEDEEDEEEEDNSMSEYEYLDNPSRTESDYYPMTLRARYHPRMVVNRTVDSALHHAVLIVTYARFFFVLAIAICFALWQGPRKTMGLMEDRPRRIRR